MWRMPCARSQRVMSQRCRLQLSGSFEDLLCALVCMCVHTSACFHCVRLSAYARALTPWLVSVVSACLHMRPYLACSAVDHLVPGFRMHMHVG